MKKIFLLLLLFSPLLGFAQGGGYVNYVTGAPSGNCSKSERLQEVMGTGTVYTCQSGTWAQISASGGGSVVGVLGTPNQITSDGSSTTPTLSIPATFIAPGTIAATTTVAGTQVISTVATGTAPLTVASTTNVANLNASSLGGATFAAPGAIGGGTPSTGAFTALSATGILASSANGALSAAAVSITGAPVTGGTGTTTFPLTYLNSGAAPSSWATTGTVFGINAPSGFAGNLVDYHLNGGGSLWLVSSGGATNQAGGATFGAATSLTFSGRSKINSSADGLITFQNNAGTSITRLNLGLNTSSGPAICVSGTTVSGCLGDGTAGGTWDFSGVSQVKLPVASGYAALADGEMGWDSAKHWPFAWGMAGNVGGSISKGLLLQSTTELDANTFAQGSSTCGVQEAINALPNAASAGGIVHLHGRCTTSTQITIRSSSGVADTVTLQGDGPNATSINYSGTGVAGIIAIGGAGYASRNIVVKDMNLSCNGALACIGINAIRTKNLVIEHILFDNSSAGSGSNTSACIVLDGGTGDFTSFAHISDNRCLNGFKDGFRQIGTGANEASSNNNLYENNEFTQLNTGTGIAYDWQTGGGNTIVGGDIQNYATGVHVTGRANQINGFLEGNTTAVNFDNSVFGAAEYNLMYGFCTPTCTILDNGRNNITIDPTNGQPAQGGPGIYWVADDFDSGNCGNFTAGRNGWHTTNVASIAGLANHPGICEITTTGSSGTVSRLAMGDDTNGIIPQGQRWIATFVAKNASAAVTNTTIRIGFADASLSNPPANGIYFENITAGSTTTWNAVARKAGTQTLTACSPAVNLDNTTWHKFEISDDGSDNLRFRIDGVSCATNANSNIPIVSLEEFFQIVNTAAQIDLLDVDFASAWMKTNR